jgi:hypothetical protein
LIQLLPGSGGGWMAARDFATPAGAVAARALSDEGDNPGLTGRVGPPVRKRVLQICRMWVRSNPPWRCPHLHHLNHLSAWSNY